MIPYSNCVHYDTEPGRRPLFQRLIGSGTQPAGYATDEGVGLLDHGTTLAEVVRETDGKAAYRVAADPTGGVIETPIQPRSL